MVRTAPTLKPRIERAALDVFVRDGFDAATTKLIAAEAQVSEGALYRHYRSKDDLAVSLFLGVHRRLGDLVASAAASAGDIREKAAAVVAAYAQVADEDWLLFAFHLLHIHRFLRHYQQDGRDPVSIVERLIAAAMLADELPLGDSRLIADMAIGAIFQVAASRAYGRLGDEGLTPHVPLMTAAVQAVLYAR
jgi:AcrR family transcriptional regulator